MVTATLYCDACGSANRPQAKFCFSCGEPLQAVAPTPSPAKSSPTGELPPNHLLKQRYYILTLVGKGGMGAVYKAQDLDFGKRLVAVKEMSLSSLGPQETFIAVGAFKREALLLAGLMHPNLPRIYDHFSENGRWYLAMDFIEGETLEKRLSRVQGGYLPVSEVLTIGIELCSVLEYLHGRQPPIIFRDLKPSNVMLASGGPLYLIDFGIARHFKPGQARDTGAFGSVGYAAPEQYGKAQTSYRSDIYSLGATLHQLLSGSDPATTPFRFAPLQSQRQAIPVELEALVMRMLNMDEGKRPASVAIIKHELQRIAAQRDKSKTAVLSLAPAPPAKVVPPTGITHVVYQNHTQRVLAVAWSPDGKSIASAGCDPHVLVWDAFDTSTISAYSGHSTWVKALAWSPHSSPAGLARIASAGADGTVQIWDANSGHNILTYHGHTNIVSTISWSPDGTYIASGGYDKTVQVWHTTSGDKIFTSRSHKGLVTAVAWSPSGRLLASASDDKTVQVWDIAAKRLLYTYHGHAAWVKTLAWSPNGTRIASGAWDNMVHVWDATTGIYVFTHSDHSSWINAISWSPMSSRIASASNDHTVQVWHASTGRELFTRRPVFIYRGHTDNVRDVAWSPDGQYLASASHDTTVRVWQAPCL